MSVARIAGGVVLLVLAGWWAASQPPVVDLATLLREPGAFAGQRVELYVETTVDSLFAGGFRLQQRGQMLTVLGELHAAAPGDFISLDGIFRADSTLVLGHYRIARHRRWKMAVSVLAVIVVLPLLWHGLRWRGGLEVRGDA